MWGLVTVGLLGGALSLCAVVFAACGLASTAGAVLNLGCCCTTTCDGFIIGCPINVCTNFLDFWLWVMKLKLCFVQFIKLLTLCEYVVS